MSGRKIFKPIAKAYKSAKAQDPSKFDGQTLVDTLSYAQFDGSEVRRSLEKALKTQHKNRKASERPSAVARIYALYEHALVDRAVWRWAVRMDQESKASGEEFFSHKRKAELAAFVRVLADDAFEQSDEILVTFNERKERRQKEGGRLAEAGLAFARHHAAADLDGDLSGVAVQVGDEHRPDDRVDRGLFIDHILQARGQRGHEAVGHEHPQERTDQRTADHLAQHFRRFGDRAHGLDNAEHG
eukprot:gene16371-19347_t